ncbi:MAG: DNA helicase RecQ [Treponema sp.]|nr:DNA helicase RecQ [Treponema sp.]
MNTRGIPLDKFDILKQYFGYDVFRRGQADVIDAILRQRDLLALMPTGAGKSLCYQIPALMLDGLAVVISPLISLMKDQVEALRSSGIHAAYLNSSLARGEYADTMNRAMRGEYTILYIAPERLDRGDMQALSAALPVPLVVIDEAHCVSQWGHDFRHSYLEIALFIKQLAQRPAVAAFTATATPKVKDDIIAQLQLRDPFFITTGFDRENLYFEVQKPKDKYLALLGMVRERKDKSGIIYCATRANVEDVQRRLSDRGIPATRYHAGLTDQERRANQDDFIYDRKPVIVATNAFGMGIDKSNVAYVIHYNMPKNIESYYQEAGRAGRDGEKADCILLYSPQDVQINKGLITRGDDEYSSAAEDRIKYNLEMLKQMTFYATASDCLRGRLLSYFGEKPPPFCGNCSNCNTQFEEIDITLESRKILSCVYRLKERGRQYGKGMVADILLGVDNQKIRQARLNTLSTYGIMDGDGAYRVRLIIDELERHGFLAASGGNYPVLSLCEKCRSLLRGEQNFTMMLPREAGPGPGALFAAKKRPAADPALLAKLKELRFQTAREEAVPAYIIFTDAALLDMCAKRPRTEEQFLDVSGVGEAKLKRYGGIFLRAIRDFSADRPEESAPPRPDLS